jgi:hypothetical protein
MQRRAASRASVLASSAGGGSSSSKRIPRAAALNSRLGLWRPAGALGPWRALAGGKAKAPSSPPSSSPPGTPGGGAKRASSSLTDPIPAFTSHLGGKPDFDLIVIGSGPAAQGCAVSSSRRGKKVAVIDKPGMLGGVCVNTGTIPSKTFREAVLHLTGACVRACVRAVQSVRWRLIDTLD